MRWHSLVWIAAAGALCGQQRLEISIEQRQVGAWKAVDPGHVFADGDQLRFRFKSTAPGYLYVVNQGTSGQHTTLFPSEEAGSDNKIEAGREYVLPSSSGAFKVLGPAGYDTVYWVLSPVNLGETRVYKPLPPPPSPSEAPTNMSPRCDDSIFRARGECVDHGGGLKENKLPGMQARELLFMQKGEKAVVSTPPPASGGMKMETKAPITYQFRIAHR